MIPLFDLASQNARLHREISAAIDEALLTSRFIGGEKVSRFEREFADYLGASHVVSCANGTDALEIALEALGIAEGDEVIVPAMTWVSTGEAVARVGARPVFADILPSEWTLDPQKVKEKLSPQTRAILPVHLYGRSAAMAELRAICDEHRLWLIEDAAQAHGGTFAGARLGSLGDAAIFSFFPTKNLGGLGDGGAMVFASEDHARTARLIATHGQTERHHHTLIGRNSRLDALNAAVLSIKLPHLDEEIEQKSAIAAHYREALGDIVCGLPALDDRSRHAWHLFTLTHERRDALAAHLAHRHIESAVHYPHALPEQPAFARFGTDPADCPVASHLGRTVLSLPCYPGMGPGDQAAVIAAVREFAR